MVVEEPRVLYQSGEQIMGAKYTVKEDEFMPQKPRVRVANLGDATEGEGPTWFDLAPDGRLAVEVPVGTPELPKPEHEVTIPFNFFDELRRRVPVGSK